jgi:hypothetical protein
MEPAPESSQTRINISRSPTRQGTPPKSPCEYSPKPERSRTRSASPSSSSYRQPCDHMFAMSGTVASEPSIVASEARSWSKEDQSSAAETERLSLHGHAETSDTAGARPSSYVRTFMHRCVLLGVVCHIEALNVDHSCPLRSLY